MKLIKLTRGKFAQVDDEDFERINQFKWYCSSVGYAVRTINSTSQKIYMHRIIMQINNVKDIIDHKDHNPLNNQKINLRVCSSYDNMRNRKSAKNSTSQYLGVSVTIRKTKLMNKILYHANIKINGKNKRLGDFKTEIEAAKAYDLKAKELHGEFANLNFKD